VLAIALALGSSLAWGISDFLGGLKSRQLALLTVVLGSQAAGLVLVTVIVVARGEGPPGRDFVLPAVLSGVAGACALAAFYRALAVGAMSVVAPITATAALVPVTVGVATGDRPSALQAVGVVVAIAGVVLASREAGEAAGSGKGPAAGVGLALVAALGFGLFFVGIDAASDDDLMWAIFVNRVASVTLVSLVVIALRKRVRGVAAADVRALVVIGLLDITANMLFAAASNEGLVSIVAVLGSLYPVTTVFLARLVLGERINRPQQVGVAGAFAGVVLITLG